MTNKKAKKFLLKRIIGKNTVGTAMIIFGLVAIVIAILTWDFPGSGTLYGSSIAHKTFVVGYFVCVICVGIVVILRWKVGAIMLFGLAGYVVVGVIGMSESVLYRVLMSLSAWLFATYLYRGLHRVNSASKENGSDE